MGTMVQLVRELFAVVETSLILRLLNISCLMTFLGQGNLHRILLSQAQLRIISDKSKMVEWYRTWW